MQPLVDLIMGESTTLDAYVVVRLIIVMMAMEFVSLIIGYLGQLRR